jgi:hypothetical protein
MEKAFKALKKPALSWLRAALASAGALYMSGITEPKVLTNAAIAGLLAPILLQIKTPELKKKK